MRPSQCEKLKAHFIALALNWQNTRHRHQPGFRNQIDSCKLKRKKCKTLFLFNNKKQNKIHTYTHIYIHTYVCVCIYIKQSLHVLHAHKYIHYVHCKYEFKHPKYLSTIHVHNHSLCICRHRASHQCKDNFSCWFQLTATCYHFQAEW